jgi:hypothetical protein
VSSRHAGTAHALEELRRDLMESASGTTNPKKDYLNEFQEGLFDEPTALHNVHNVPPLCATSRESGSGHEEACLSPRRHGRSSSESRQNRCGAEDFGLVPEAEIDEIGSSDYWHHSGHTIRRGADKALI